MPPATGPDGERLRRTDQTCRCPRLLSHPLALTRDGCPTRMAGSQGSPQWPAVKPRIPGRALRKSPPPWGRPGERSHREAALSAATARSPMAVIGGAEPARNHRSVTGEARAGRRRRSFSRRVGGKPHRRDPAAAGPGQLTRRVEPPGTASACVCEAPSHAVDLARLIADDIADAASVDAASGCPTAARAATSGEAGIGVPGRRGDRERRGGPHTGAYGVGVAAARKPHSRPDAEVHNRPYAGQAPVGARARKGGGVGVG